MNPKPPVQETDVIVEGLIDKAREAFPAYAVADTPDGVALSRSDDIPDVTTKAWVVETPEDEAVTISDLFDKYGDDKVLLYLEPERWDFNTGKPWVEDDPLEDDAKDPYRAPVGMTAALTEPRPWGDGPVAAAIVARVESALATLERHTATLERAADVLPVGVIASMAPPVGALDDTDDLADKVFGAPPSTSPLDLYVAVMLDNADAQRQVVEQWEAAYQPGMTHRELVAVTMPPRPTGPMMLTEAWDQVAHEAGVWIAAQTGETPPDGTDGELFDGMSAADIPEVEDVPLDQPPAVTAAYYTEAQVREAAGDWLDREGHPVQVGDEVMTGDGLDVIDGTVYRYGDAPRTVDYDQGDYGVADGCHGRVDALLPDGMLRVTDWSEGDVSAPVPAGLLDVITDEDPEWVARTAAYKPGMSHTRSTRSSTYLSDREHEQRINAGRISAERRRKAKEELARKRMNAPRHYRDGSVAPTEFQEAMGIFARRGVRGEDLERDPNTGHLHGKTAGAHQRFAQAMNDSGYDVSLFADGSGVARRGSHAVLLAPPKSGDWSLGAVRMDRPSKAPKARKSKEPPRAWGRKKKRG